MAIPDHLTFLMGHWHVLPVLILYLGGIAIALVRWKRHPSVSLLSLIACFLLTLQILLNLSVSWMMFRQSMAQGGPASLSMLMGLSGILSTLLTCTAWVLVFIALFFAKRPGATTA